MAGRFGGGLWLFCAAAVFSSVTASAEVCTNSLLPGAKGDQGEIGEVGVDGKLGKNGPAGPPGAPGETGLKGEVGHEGKMGPNGGRGDKGDTGPDGPSGLQGKPGAMCDCGRYRKVVGQLDVSVGRLRNAVRFVKNVIVGLTETEDKYYLLVKEPRRFRDASMNCKLRGGALAMPKTVGNNRLMADYISQAGLTHVYIGVEAQNKDTDGTNKYHYADSSPLQGFAAWSREEGLNSSSANTSCVELLSTGTWGHVDCDATMFFICEFPKSRRRGSGRILAP